MLMQKNIIFHTKDFVYENSWDLMSISVSSVHGSGTKFGPN